VWVAEGVLQKHRRFLRCCFACELEAGAAKGAGKILSIHDAAVGAEGGWDFSDAYK